jgi:hypothetical protein
MSPFPSCGIDIAWYDTDGRLARAFKRAGWKVIGVEEEG